MYHSLVRIALVVLVQATVFVATLSYAEPKYRIVIMPKLVGISYYDMVKQGIEEADQELSELDVLWSGPTQDRVEKQIDLLEQLIPAKPDLIAVAANDPVAIVPILKKARETEIRIMSWDGDTNFREFFVNLVDYQKFGTQLVEALVEEIGTKGDIAIVTTTFTAPNQVQWMNAIKRYIYTNYPQLKIMDIRPAGESTEESYRITRDYLKGFATLKGIIALGVPNVPGVAKAVKEAGKAGKIAVVGNSTPNLMRAYLKEGSVKKVLLWNAPDHGYLTVYCAYRLLIGDIQLGHGFRAGRLGTFFPQKDGINMQVALPVLIFTKDNVDQYHF